MRTGLAQPAYPSVRKVGKRDRTSLRVSPPSLVEQRLGFEIALPQFFVRFLLIGGVALWLAGLAIYFAYSSGGWLNLAGAVAADLGGTTFLLALLGRSRRNSLLVTPLTGFLAMFALRRLIGLIYVLQKASALNSPFAAVPTVPYLASSAKAEWVTLLGTIAFSIGWIIGRPGKRRDGSRLTGPSFSYDFDKILWIVYFIGLFVLVGEHLSSGLLQRLGSIVTITGSLAYGAVFVLLAFSRKFGVKGPLHWVTLLAVAPILISSLSLGMKGSLLIALLPIALAYLLRKPGKGLIFLSLALLFLLVFVYPYVQQFRKLNWDKQAGVPVGQVVAQMSDSVKMEGLSHTIKQSWSDFELRFGSINEAGAVVYFSDLSGHVGGLFLRNLLYGFVPRAIWPGKPSWDPANWFTAFITGDPNIHSSTALHIGPELYWMYGWPGTFLGLMLLGLFYRRVSDWLIKRGIRNPIFLAAWYDLLVSTTLIEEVRYNAAILSVFILVVNVLVISYVFKALLPAYFARLMRSAGHQMQ